MVHYSIADPGAVLSCARHSYPLSYPPEQPALGPQAALFRDLHAVQKSAPADSCTCEQGPIGQRASVHLLVARRSTQRRLPISGARCLVRPNPNDVVYATRLPFDPGSSDDGCANRSRRTSYVEGLWSPSLAIADELRAKAHAISRVPFIAQWRVFLSQAGPRFGLELVQAEHHLSSSTSVSLPKRRRRPPGSPSLGVCVRLAF